VEQLGEQLASDLSVSVVRLARHLRGRRQGAPVSLTQLSAMSILRTEGPMSPGQMAAMERVQPPSMTRVIASLVDLGYINRDPHPTDGRQVVVSLSPAGEAILEDETHAREAWLRNQLSMLDEESINAVQIAIVAFDKMVAYSD
jgi:DNA-binding MarR family transcriptional regulator